MYFGIDRVVYSTPDKECKDNLLHISRVMARQRLAHKPDSVFQQTIVKQYFYYVYGHLHYVL